MNVITVPVSILDPFGNEVMSGALSLHGDTYERVYQYNDERYPFIPRQQPNQALGWTLVVRWDDAS